MDELSDFCPTFDRPPVVETKISVQFAPLTGFRSGHFGLFWNDCVGVADWRIREDSPPLPKEYEHFGSKAMRPQGEVLDEEFPQVRMRLFHKTQNRRIQFQPNKLVYAWGKDKGSGSRPRFSKIKEEFEEIFEKLNAFAGSQNLPKPEVNLWELTYVNQILPGKLWTTINDWHKVLPGLFPKVGPNSVGHEWSSFLGEWFFVIPPQQGRVHVKVQKAVSNQSEDIVLLVNVTAAGEISENGTSDWKSGLDIGHRSALRVFFDLSSLEAKEEWGYKNDR